MPVCLRATVPCDSHLTNGSQRVIPRKRDAKTSVSRNYELLQSIGEKLESPQHMLRIAPSGNYRPSLADQIPAAQTGNFEWLRAFVALQRHWRSSAAFAAFVSVTVTLAVFTQRPVYEPAGTVEIDPAISELGLPNTGGSGSSDAEYLETQAKNLGSDEMLIAVIRRLHLDQNSEFVDNPGNSFFTRLKLFGSVDKQAKDYALQGSEQSNGVFQLSQSENIALRSFRSRLTITRDTSSRLVSAAFSSHNPRLAALVANTLINLFIERSYTTRHDEIMRSSGWLAKQLDDVKEAMQKSNATLADYEKTWGIADLGGDEKPDSTFTQGMAELNRQLTQAEADRIQLQAYVSGLESGNDVQQVSSDLVIQNLTQKLADVRTALSEAVVVYGANHPNVKKLQNQASELQLQINAQRKAIIGRLKTSYADAQVREKLLRQEMRTATDQASHVGQYNILKKEAQTNRDLYNTLYTRVKEASISAESKASNIRVVDRARILDRPTRPDRLLITIFGLLAGVLGGVVIAFLKERFDTTVRHPDDMRRSTGISGISVMPTFESTNGSKAGILEPLLAQRNQANFEMAGTRSFFLERPRSREAEALRALQTSIMVRWPGDLPHVIQIVSACPGEGKTTIAVNLAVALSKQSRTCLVDADLRKPGIAASFGLFPHQGLGEVLAGSASLEATLVDAPGLKNLSILPSCPSTCPEQFLVSPPAMQQIVWALRQQFQQVIIDSAPLIAYADGRAIASLVDGLILVGRFGYTTREAMAQTIALLAHLNAAPIIEVVLNDANYAFLEHEYRYQANT